MLTIYQNDAVGQLQTVPDMAYNSLLYFVNPTNVEVSRAAESLSVPEDFIRDPLDMNERPRIERRGDLLLMVLNLPIEQKEEGEVGELPYRTVPIGIIHAPNQMIIISKEEVPLLSHVIAGKYGSFQTHMKTRITLLVFAAIAQSFVDYLTRITARVAQLQQDLKKANRNRELFELIHLNKSLVYFSTSLRAMRIVFQHLSTGKVMKLYKEDERMLQDALIDLEQAADVTELRRESLSSLMDAYAAIVHNNVNGVLKILTTLAIVFMIPTMIGSIFSMNVALPHEEEWGTTIVVGGLIAAISGVLIYLFYKTKFLRQ